MFIFIILLLVIPVAIYKSYKSRIKGAIGEETVAFRLARLPKSEYKVINDLVLSSVSRTSQIDHLIISDYGLFVIETKNIKGWIFGRERRTSILLSNVLRNVIGWSNRIPA